MTRFLTLAVTLLIMATNVSAQKQVLVEITDVSNEALRTKMSKNATALLTELNTAYFDNKTPTLTFVNMSNSARQNVSQIWENSAYRCIETEIITRGLETSKGYQIRNLPFIIKEGNENQSAVINFTPVGEIESFYFAIADHAYQSIIKANKSVTDLRRRQMILDFIENFRTAYNRKDLPVIASMYSDDVLIIVGNVIKSTGIKEKGIPGEHIEYIKRTKSEYMERLGRVFKLNNYVNVSFDNIEVNQHPNPKFSDIYGVTLKQAWRTSNYSDDGWLFLAIKFYSETEMYIQVRTWQPHMLNGKVLSRDEVFQLGQFKF